jgi:hypothetical protein
VLDKDAAAWPCGLVAKSFFNDTYTVTNKNGTQIKIDETGIAWDSDKTYKFKLNTEGSDGKNKYWVDVTNGKILVL